MADVEYDVAGGAKRRMEDMGDGTHAELIVNGGCKSAVNSTGTPLVGDGAFIGEWEVSNFEHACVNVISDQEATLYVDFGILKDGVDPDGDIADEDLVITLAAPRTIYAGVPYFRPLVKMPGRAIRVRLVNGSTPQTSLALLTSFGNNLFPASASDDNEMLVTVTERERNALVAFAKQDVAADGHGILIDISDTANFPHDRTGRIDLTATYFQVDRATNSTGSVRLGVITRVDGTSADVTYVQGVRFDKSNEQHIERDRNYSPSQIKLGVVDGVANRVKGVNATGITAINTGASLESPNGAASVVPGVGDVVLSWTRAAANYDFSISAFYHSEASA
ncbi:hypothetical protein E2A64_10300 [Pseudohoeflea suaedae]|uniref:Uncharacterized protein n=1 Tax=Pseudohoeflea suaedae TaxID=877384 RepID=A0A4R5PKA4_9HYPH|nr:hypothetical protein [Pseudohoeflea suaedae]TDH35718.1 hypothetical protein E2A64_10300 [Pseudohoeflea suaedae]